MRALLIAMLAIAALVFPISLALAQNTGATTNTNSNYTNSPHLNSTQNTVPILAKVSDKRHYLVEIRWEPAPQSASPDFNLEIYFLNTTDAKATTASVNSSSPSTGNKSQSLVNGPQYFTDTSGLERTVAIDTYDIAVYDNSGHVLYQKTNQPSQAGKGAQSVSVGNYTGPVSIQITNIKPVAGYLPGNPTDSVTFAASVVPEFPMAALVLIVGISSAAVIRFAGRKFQLY
jgi:hypothetical protein